MNKHNYEIDIRHKTLDLRPFLFLDQGLLSLVLCLRFKLTMNLSVKICVICEYLCANILGWEGN